MEIAFRKPLRYDGESALLPWVSHFSSLGFNVLISIMRELEKKTIAKIILAPKFYDPQSIESISHPSANKCEKGCCFRNISLEVACRIDWGTSQTL